jgi:hypothetical protein
VTLDPRTLAEAAAEAAVAAHEINAAVHEVEQEGSDDDALTMRRDVRLLTAVSQALAASSVALHSAEGQWLTSSEALHPAEGRWITEEALDPDALERLAETRCGQLNGSYACALPDGHEGPHVSITRWWDGGGS